MQLFRCTTCTTNCRFRHHGLAPPGHSKFTIISCRAHVELFPESVYEGKPTFTRLSMVGISLHSSKLLTWSILPCPIVKGGSEKMVICEDFVFQTNVFLCLPWQLMQFRRMIDSKLGSCSHNEQKPQKILLEYLRTFFRWLMRGESGGACQYNLASHDKKSYPYYSSEEDRCPRNIAINQHGWARILQPPQSMKVFVWACNLRFDKDSGTTS